MKEYILIVRLSAENEDDLQERFADIDEHNEMELDHWYCINNKVR